LRRRAVEDGAVLVVDNATGDVVAYVGSSGDLSRARYVDGVTAPRQAGSILKPFLYGLAIDRTLVTAAAMLDDGPLEVPVPGGLYRPRNYDERFRGPVSVRAALAGSINVPAVHLLELVGTEAFVGHLRALGFATLPHAGSYYGPSLALGSADVTLWDVVSAYRALARGGLWSPLRLAATDPRAADRRVLAPGAAFIIGDVLADRESRADTFGLENALATPFWSAAKTGTSKAMRDNWCVGWTSRYTVGVWVGNFDGTPMHDVSGVTGAAPIWREIVTALHADATPELPTPPDDVVARAVTFALGGEPARREWFVAGTEPSMPVTRAAPIARIVGPRHGTIVAIDPDIPPDHQRLALEASGSDDASWVLDDRPLGRADGLVLWAPVPGTHRLVLRDRQGHDLDRVTFDVRGRRDARR
jgi:penicillin-binding protein 1C